VSDGLHANAFVLALGQRVAFEAADGTPLVGVIDRVPTGNEVWFRIRNEHGTFERRYYEIKKELP
jgi:hypothetical protein